jgi:transcriptional regulator with GAF, ATPase, and Fis domain
VEIGLEWAQEFSRIARTLAGLRGTTQTLTKIAELATGVAECPWAAITRAAAPAPIVAATSDPQIADQIGRLQALAGGGPTWAAITQKTTIYVPDLVVERRWPEHTESLLDKTPVRSVLALVLRLEEEVLGTLTLYGDRTDAFAEPTYTTATVYADHAAIALDREFANDKAMNLEIALQTSREIGIAIGILVERHKITPGQAFDLLRAASQRRHRKLRELAGDLVLTGDLDTSIR